MTNQDTSDEQPGTTAAAQMLKAGDSVGNRVREAIDTRTQATVDAWMAAGTLAYSFAFVLSSFENITRTGVDIGAVDDSGDGRTVVFLIMAAVFTMAFLAEGLTDSLRKPASRPSGVRRFWAAASSALPLLSLLILTFAAPATPWPAVLAVAVVAVVPMVTLALRSATRAHAAGVRRPAPSFSALPDPADRAITAILGVALGALCVATGMPDPLVGTIAFIIFVLALMGTRGSRVGVDRAAQFWGRAQWTAFGFSYLGVLGLAVLLARTPWDLTVVSIVGGVLVAAPLVFAAFRPAPIWEA
jgi:hypothetical protein